MKSPKILQKALPQMFFLALLGALNLNATIVNPQTGQSSWELASKLGTVFDEDTPTLLSDADATGGILTIDTAGRYMLKENLTSRIVIDEDDVCLDLNCRSITRSTATDNIVTVNSSKSNIKIFNGSIENTAGPGTGHGILVDDSASRVRIKNIKISTCANGVRLDGTDGSEVTKCKIIGCDFVGNTTGVVLNYADKNILRDSRAIDNAQAGYELFHSEINSVFGCKAIDTINTTDASGFLSTSGNCNLFKDCIVKNTETSSSTFCDKANGFLLTGTENKTKIIACIINDTEATSEDGISYGIHLDPTLLATADLLDEVDNDNTPAARTYAVAWSPCSRYLASGDNNDYVRVYSFNGSQITHLDGDNIAGNAVSSVSWSPNGRYLATSDWSFYVRIFSFDGSHLTYVDEDGTSPGSIDCMKWSPNEKYIAAGDSGGRLHAYTFNGTQVARVDTNVPLSNPINALSWSPDGQYIATGDWDGYVRVFSLNDDTLLEIDDDNTAGTVIWAIAWSPNGKYIVSGDQNGDLHMFSFNGTDLTPVTSDSTPGTDVRSVAWSPNGKYIVAGDIGDYVRVFSFNGATLTHIKGVDTVTDDIYGVSWSSCGKYIASSDDSGYIRVFDAMYGPEQCLIKENVICDTNSYGQLVGTGIVTGGNNCVVQNCCCNNEANYSFGIPHVYYADQSDTIRPHDNISTPPY
ncbi:beta-propeller fold lactonase family protein [Candidatus Dependentiae bacterium]